MGKNFNDNELNNYNDDYERTSSYFEEDYEEYPEEDYPEEYSEEYGEYSEEEYTEEYTEEEYTEEYVDEYSEEGYEEEPEEYVEDYEELDYVLDEPVAPIPQRRPPVPSLPPNHPARAKYVRGEQRENRFKDFGNYEEEETEGKSPLTKIMIALAAAVVVLVLITVGAFVMTENNIFSLKSTAGNGIVKNEELIGAGSALAGIDKIGASGLDKAYQTKLSLIAAADEAEAERLRLEAEAEKEKKEYEETEYNDAIDIKLELSTILKDLKVKFVNTKTGKLIANIPFEVKVTYPDGSTKTWKDDDKDGIIYYEGLKKGSYKVSAIKLEGDEYKKYIFPVDRVADVKDQLEYKKVDIASEVLDASQVDENAEDTARDGADTGGSAVTIAPALKDTVAFVESTTKVVYEPIDKGTIQVASVKSLRVRTTANEGSGDNSGTGTGDGTGSGDSGNTGGTTDPGTGTTDPGTGGTDPGTGGGSDPGTTTPDPAPQTPKPVITLTAPNTSMNLSGINLAKGTATQVLLSYQNVTKDQLTISSSNANVATAWIGNGIINIDAKGAGTCTITVSNNVDNTVSASCTVVVPANPKVTLSAAALDVAVGRNGTATATFVDMTAGEATAASSNTAVATVAMDGNGNLTITGVAAGTANITVTKNDNAQVTATMTVTVSVGKLKTTDGQQVYVSDDGGKTFREATYADYNSATTFYKAKTVYTGWQTIGTEKYYFTAEGKAVTGNQVISGVSYTFNDKGVMTAMNTLGTGGAIGIDVSKWNGNIDWAKVKAAGVNYVIIRIGYRGSTQGGLIDDAKFKENIAGATKAGLQVGCYFVTQAVNEVEAIEEASVALNRVAGYSLSYPIYLDVEASNGRGDKIDKATRTAVCKAFCQTVSNAGYRAGVYANKSWLTNKIDASQLSGYSIWVAQYYDTCTYTGSYDIWQYTSKGSVDGIKGNVDLNKLH